MRNIVVDGVVLQVQGELCEVSLGSDDGLKIGDVLDVSRQKSLVSQIEIARMQPNKAVGRFIDDTKAVRIQKGDRVLPSQK